MTRTVVTGPPVKRRKEFDENKELPFLDFPNEIIFRCYGYFDLESRMKMKSLGNKRLNNIEMETKYRYGSLDISYNNINHPRTINDIRLVCDDSVVDVPHSVALKEFELLAKNTHFNLVTYKTCIPEDDSTCQLLSSLEAKTIVIEVFGIDDATLDMVMQNKERVIVRRSNVTTDALWNVYGKMKEGSIGVKYVKVETHDVESRFEFLGRLGSNYDRIDGFTPRENQKMKFENFKLVVTEGNLKVVASVLCWCGRFPGFVSFEIIDGEDKAEEDDEDILNAC
ncbi:hypothetical protein PRIPAC_86374 [Pristionchus pacificus]|uniref:Uncharacterized protein n=1 Tax=Pristionchus pacificus TaxID=54126 RepID=A0A2A6CEI4_PRIPA|nr:hypothetical protein PRIPAC_86374 [Pristionchus pacificus]|eukprot:PDM76510.1 hypothetical protein PRIPAC_42876 [Pristionchus pacificus]